MDGQAILAPVVALLVWTMIIWFWMYATRIPAMSRAGIDAAGLIGSSPGGLRAELVAKGEQRASWVADNYNHLHEAPVIFYAVGLALAVMQLGDGVNATIAWVYVALRILHSLVQIFSNRVVLRFSVFVLSSIALMALVVRAGLAVF